MARVSRSGIRKIDRAIASGWKPALRAGPGEFMRTRKADKKRKVKP
jgi:hypothetical protein